MSDAPERIWAAVSEIEGAIVRGLWADTVRQIVGGTEYRRADLSKPEDAARIAALEAALRPFAAAVFNDNGDVTISTGNISRANYMAARAALQPKE